MREYTGNRGVPELLEEARGQLAPEDSEKTEDPLLFLAVPACMLRRAPPGIGKSSSRRGGATITSRSAESFLKAS